jgi:uncharacterized protein (TIGR02284 family)
VAHAGTGTTNQFVTQEINPSQQMNASQTVRTLDELRTVTREGERGFRAGAARARDPLLRAQLFECAHACARAGLELTDWIERLGGQPSLHGGRIGAMHRGWRGLRAALARNDDRAILAECQRGEGHALAIYRNALDDHLPHAVRELVLRQFEGVMENYEGMRRLHECLHPAPATVAPTGGEAAP